MADCKTETVLNGLRKHQKEIPTSLHYDAKGSKIYEEITRLDSYYLFNAERELFEENAMDIANAIIPGSLFVELGCGNACKTTTLLNAIKNVHGRLCNWFFHFFSYSLYFFSTGFFCFHRLLNVIFYGVMQMSICWN